MLLLASEHLSNVTGSTYVTDGGLMKTLRPEAKWWRPMPVDAQALLV